MRDFEVLEHVSSFGKYDLDRLINGFLNNDDNLPFWAIGGLGDIEIYFFHEGFWHINVVANWRDGFVLTVSVWERHLQARTEELCVALESSPCSRR